MITWHNKLATYPLFKHCYMCEWAFL